MHAVITLEPTDESTQEFTADEFETLEPTAVNWNLARCRDGNGTLTHLFFGDDVLTIARAKAICSKCTLGAACIEGALERLEPWGVWGGELIENGKIVAHKRPRGRPPKHPRPTLVVEEVPIPRHYVA